jgi:hypothetical protein
LSGTPGSDVGQLKTMSGSGFGCLEHLEAMSGSGLGVWNT